MTPALPNASEISVFGSVDEQYAVEHFLGKDLHQAEALFRENFALYQEDLMWMGPKAFCFYVHAAMNYLRGDRSNCDSDAAAWFYIVVSFQLEHYAPEVAPAVPAIREGILAILGKFSQFKCDPSLRDDINDIVENYTALLTRLDQHLRSAHG